jgi:hypothetical protein
VVLRACYSHLIWSQKVFQHSDRAFAMRAFLGDVPWVPFTFKPANNHRLKRCAGGSAAPRAGGGFKEMLLATKISELVGQSDCRRSCFPADSQKPDGARQISRARSRAMAFTVKSLPARSEFPVTPQSESARRIQGSPAPGPGSPPETGGGNHPHRLRLQDSRKEPLLARRAFPKVAALAFGAQKFKTTSSLF